MKFLVLGVLFYFLYRLIMVPPAIGKGEGKIKIKEKPDKKNDGEYIDYEEIE